MELGQIITSDGKQRKVIGFSLAEGRNCPITEPYEQEIEAVEQVVNEEQKTEQKAVNVTIKYICRYCGKECKNQIGLDAHEKACDKNPESKNYKG